MKITEGREGEEESHDREIERDRDSERGERERPTHTDKFLTS